jgi:hypothetical protein
MTSPDGKLIYLVLDDAPGARAEAYERARDAALAELRASSAVVRTLAFRGAAEPPGGVRTSDQEPSHMTLVELSAAGPLFDGSIAGAFARTAGLATPVLRRGFHEMDPAQRDGPFLPDGAERSVFLIVQDVPPEGESAYNYWFDVDDGSRPAGGPMSHLQERLRFPGFVRATRLRAVPFAADGAEAGAVLRSNYITLFELDSVEALQSDAYVASSRPSPGRAPVKRPFRLRVRHGYAEQAAGPR